MRSTARRVAALDPGTDIKPSAILPAGPVRSILELSQTLSNNNPCSQRTLPADEGHARAIRATAKYRGIFLVIRVAYEI